jgi:hypothetical protein
LRVVGGSPPAEQANGPKPPNRVVIRRLSPFLGSNRMFAVIAKRLALVLAAGLFSACAMLPGAPAEEVVAQRAQARWDALLAGDWARAYRYMAPSYRALVEEKRYANQFGGGAAWVAAKVVRVQCSDDRCKVVMEVTYRPILGMRAGQTATSGFDETWIREDGQWWMFQKV